MKISLTFGYLLFVLAHYTVAQLPLKSYQRSEVGCLTLLSERSNVVFMNDTNLIDFHFNGYRSEALTLKGDASVEVLNKNRIIPTKDTFTLYIYAVVTDSLLFEEQFLAIPRDSLRQLRNNSPQDVAFCDYITATKNERIVYRSRINRLFLRRNNFVDTLLTFEVLNGALLSENPDYLLIQPGNQPILTVKVYYDGKLALVKEFLVRD